MVIVTCTYRSIYLISLICVIMISYYIEFTFSSHPFYLWILITTQWIAHYHSDFKAIPWRSVIWPIAHNDQTAGLGRKLSLSVPRPLITAGWSVVPFYIQYNVQSLTINSYADYVQQFYLKLCLPIKIIHLW